MADFGGFNIPTPQEVLAERQAQRSKVFSQGSVQQQRSFNIEQALDIVFGNPQQRQANRMQTRMQSAQDSVQKNEGEEPLDFEMRRLASMRDAVSDVDPATASQINARLLELGEAKFQRTRLMASDHRAEELHSTQMSATRDEATMRKLTGGNTYVLNKQSGATEAFDLLDPAQDAAFKAAAAKPGAMVITPAQAFQLYHDKTIEAMKVRKQLAEADGLSKVTSQQVERASAGLLDMYATADRIFQVLETNPDVLSASSAGAAKLDKVATELAAAGRYASGGKTVEGQSIDDWLKANSITNTRAQGLTVGLAYATAKANDPSGRISDKDLAAALEMVGGNNPNPAAIIANLNDNLTARSQGLFDRMDTLPEGVRNQMVARRKVLGDRAASFHGRFEKYAQGRLGQSAAGATPASTPDADGWMTINGKRVRKVQK
jgi:hypothetical protein